jgi:hypothetical protein
MPELIVLSSIMTKVILEVPTDKMQAFLSAVLGLGITTRVVSSGEKADIRHSNRRRRRSHTHKFPSFLLFDWEFFSNELEYE